MNKKAVVLLSGGLDSAVTLFLAKSKGYECYCLNFDYAQRHKIEMAMAGKLASLAGADLKTERISLSWGGSSLLDAASPLPVDRTPSQITASGITDQE